MLRHVAMGYSVHMQRLLGHLTWWIFPLLMPGYTDLTKDGKELRANVFISCFLGHCPAEYCRVEHPADDQ
ncbi:unnamed protein product [Ectocarpus sp. CCAP 1310/34]|nr:unnamed protein product [Ectocarpus sp. CCAP 1310/34]